MDDRALLILTALGTLLTAVFTGYPIVQRAIDRPRPRWRAVRSAQASHVWGSDRWFVVVTVTNVGDGAAYQPSLSSDRSIVLTSDVRAASKREPAEALQIGVEIDHTGPAQRTDYGGELDLPASDEMIGDVSILLTWQQPPHRWWTRRKRVPVRKLPIG
jgi:hypothetical protein